MAKKPPMALAPAGARHLALPSVLEEQSLALIEKTLGGREALVAALAHAPKSRDLEFLLGLIGDPLQAKVPLGHLCAQGGVTPGELLAAWKAGEILRGHVLATKQIVAALPAVVQDVLKRAAPYEDTCTGCQGLGQITPEPTKKVPNPEPKTCPACQGQGKLLYEADLERAKMALDLAQLTPKGNGVQVNLNQQAVHLHQGGGSAGGTLEAMMSASDAILYGESENPLAPPAQPPAPLPPEDIIDAEPLSGGDSDPA